MTRTELHSVDPEHRVSDVGELQDESTGDEHRRSTGSTRLPGQKVKTQDALSAAWWWGLLPWTRWVFASSSWASLGARAATVLCRGAAQLAAGCWLLLGLVLLAAPPAALVGLIVLTMLAGLALFRSRRSLSICVVVGAVALGAGALWLPDLVLAAVASVLMALGLGVLALPAARAVYPQTERGRIRTGYGVDGWAGWWELHRHLSAHAVRIAAAATRPSVAGEVVRTPSEGQRPVAGLLERLAVRRCGTWLGRSVVGPVIGTQCYAAHRDVVGLVAPPQTGKTALMGHHIIDHDGPVLATSTKPDLYNYCAGSRAKRGPVWLFNPEQLGGLGSSVWWSPVSGCADAQVAATRAGLMVDGVSSGDDDGDRWDQWSVGVLSALLMAADLAGRDMATVAQWVFSPGGDPRQGGAGEALALLGKAAPGRVPPGTIAALQQVLTTDARKTRDSIFMTLSEAVKFMTDPQVASLATGAAGGHELDAEELVTGEGTLFLVGSDRAHATIAPLLAAMTGHVFETAKQVAAARPKGRLDPPLGLFLDEAALITPVPLDRWVADAGGRGVHIEWAVQSPSQLAQRWGARGAETIWNATTAKVVFGGLSLDDDLEQVSVLCGHRYEPAPTGDGSERYDRVRVCPVDKVRTLPQWHALLVHRATPATIVRVGPVWERGDLLPAPAIMPCEQGLGDSVGPSDEPSAQAA